MQPHTPRTESLPSGLRRLFPKAMTDNGMNFEAPEILLNATRQACAHELIYHSHNRSDKRLHPTRSTERRLLNVAFTEGLEALAMRTDNNPFARCTEANQSVGRLALPKFEQQLVIVIHERITDDEPNALQELFAEHLKDLTAYLEGHALPPAAFLVACAVFVARVKRRRPSLHMHA